MIAEAPVLPKVSRKKAVQKIATRTMPGFRPIRGAFPRNADTGAELDPDTELLPKVSLEEASKINRAVRKYTQLSPWRAMLALAVDWIIMGTAFALAIIYPHPLVWVGAAIFIAARQHALMILMHEAVHYRLFENREWADRISNWFMAYPLMFTTESFRAHHLAHHNYFNTDHDPDWTRKVGKREWVFPQTKMGLFALLLTDLLGFKVFDNMRPILGAFFLKPKAKSKMGSTDSGEQEQQSNFAVRIPWKRLAYYAMIGSVITWAGYWPEVLLLWFLPEFTVMQVFMRLRSISEHWGVKSDDLLSMTRTYPGTALECFFIVPHNINIHIEHHLYPSIPYYNLRKLRKVLMTLPVYANRSHHTDTILGLSGSSVLQELTK